MCYDYGMWIAERIYQDKQWWIANTNMRRSLDDKFALTPARTAVIPMKEQIRKGTEKLQRVFEDVEVPALPEARRLWTKERPIGIQIIKTHLREVAQRHAQGRTIVPAMDPSGKTDSKSVGSREEIGDSGVSAHDGVDLEPCCDCKNSSVGLGGGKGFARNS